MGTSPKREFDAQITDVFSPGYAQRRGVHTYGLLLDARLPESTLERLKRINGPGQVVHPRRLSKCRTHRHVLRIHRPRREALAYLARHTRRCLLSRMDIAVDTFMPSWEQACAASSFCTYHGSVPWHVGLHYIFVPKSGALTSYSRGASGEGRILVCYPKIIDGEPACHIESRVFGAEAIGRLGLSFAAILDLDVDDFLRRCHQRLFRFSMLDLDKLKAQIDRDVDLAMRRGWTTDPDEYRTHLCKCLSHSVQQIGDEWGPVSVPSLPGLDDLPSLAVQHLVDSRFTKPAVIHRPATLILLFIKSRR
jgi:hypothetical protein